MGVGGPLPRWKLKWTCTVVALCCIGGSWFAEGLRASPGLNTLTGGGRGSGSARSPAPPLSLAHPVFASNYGKLGSFSLRLRRAASPSTATSMTSSTSSDLSVNWSPRLETLRVVAPPPGLLDGETCKVTQEAQMGTFVDQFRGALPYLRMHRGAAFVIHVPGEVISSACFQPMMDDIALLSLLGLRIVLVVGSRPQTDELLVRKGIDPEFVGSLRITSREALQVCKEAAGFVRFEVESSLARGPRSANGVNVSGGNFFSAQPVGVHDGVDFGYTGVVRRIETKKILSRLGEGDIVQLTSIGYSTTGEVYHVDTVALATETASQLGAAKLIFVTEGQTMLMKHGEGHEEKVLHSLRLSEARQALKTLGERDGVAIMDGVLTANGPIKPHPISRDWDENGHRDYTVLTADMMKQSIKALSHGVLRAHLVPPTNGALLQELFTRDGAGVLISRDIYDGIRRATHEDVSGIRDIIRPLENSGVLVARPREMLERDLKYFYVYVRDNSVLACAYLKAFGDTHAEIGCLAVHPTYRHGGRGEALLSYLERVALSKGIDYVFVLSTRTMQWFEERGFIECPLEDLPPVRQAMYNWERRSKVFRKRLKGSRELDAEELFWDIT